MVTANSGDYHTLKRVIKKLDIPRLQVFIETAILEVSLDKSDTVGSNLALSANGRLFAGGFIGDGNALQKVIQNALPGPGLTLPFVLGQGFQNPLNLGGTTQQYIQSFPFMGMVNMITTRANTSVLSTPQIIALDNEKAEFKVQDETPVQTSFVASVSGASSGAIGQAGQGTIENKKTGIDINVTPHINAASKSIRLEIEQKVDSIRNAAGAVPTALQNVQIATTSRVTNTSVVVKDQDYIMLGGLMSERVDESVKKVPLLGDIPIIGWLFKAKTHTNTKSNLVVLLHPRIIATSSDSARVVEEGFGKHDTFIEENFSGEDPHTKRVDALKDKIEAQKARATTDDTDPFSRYRNNGPDEDDPKKETDAAADAPADTRF